MLFRRPLQDVYWYNSGSFSPILKIGTNGLEGQKKKCSFSMEPYERLNDLMRTPASSADGEVPQLDRLVVAARDDDKVVEAKARNPVGVGA